MGVQVLLTSYEVLQKDIGHLAKFEWGYCIVDEAHRSVDGPFTPRCMISKYWGTKISRLAPEECRRGVGLTWGPPFRCAG